MPVPKVLLHLLAGIWCLQVKPWEGVFWNIVQNNCRIPAFDLDGVYFVAGAMQLLSWKAQRERRSLIWKQE